MHAYLFKDRSARTIAIELDERTGRALAWHRDQLAGWLDFESVAGAHGVEFRSLCSNLACEGPIVSRSR
ncbi:hypothetical protein QYH69_08495 [Paraburkholderia sp. SARCC-3016]|jgi:hypothetical protein|uniref:hypothetical protein n=1 Tax=Paraburkholderia sp. SARCC-3016 TaxID=3058611 RepID=UPI00280A0ED4|nr:hypothetical protein [Paraburkholderia sp. SARCC-3016]MDQ7977285.1 hypothetical protein [Paraburkholderia sp. SARCC-3016]